MVGNLQAIIMLPFSVVGKELNPAVSILVMDSALLINSKAPFRVYRLVLQSSIVTRTSLTKR